MALADETIPWSRDALLRWSDFRAEPSPSGFEDASCVVRYGISWTVDSESSGGRVEYFVADVRLEAEFFPWLSWVRQMYATPELLRHEQGHFDLAEMLRRDAAAGMRGEFCGRRYAARGHNEEQRKQFARDHTGSLLGRELKKWQARMEEAQSEYDRRTDFGQDREAQSAYDARFSGLRG